MGSREGLELALRSEFDDDDAVSAAQIVVGEGWHPPDEVAALKAAIRNTASRDLLAYADRILGSILEWDDQVAEGKSEGPMPNGLLRSILHVRQRIASETRERSDATK